MNFRITLVLFALLLTTLFAFGLMVARRKSVGDVTAVSPTLGSTDAKVDKVRIKATVKDGDKEKEAEYEFVQIGDLWFHKQGDQKAKVDGFRIKKQIIDKLKEARHDETADVSRDVGFYMKPLRMTVTLEGTLKDEPKKWEFFIGKENPDRSIAYINSAERADRVFAVPTSTIADFFFADPRHLRPKRLFDFIADNVTAIHVKKADKELEVNRSEKSPWTITKPPLGFAGVETEVEEKKKEFQPKETAVTSVKTLIDKVLDIRIKDDDAFEPLGKPLSEYGLGKDQESMKIDITAGDKKDSNTETLYIGKKVPAAGLRGRTGEYYYARLGIDENVMQVGAEWIDPIDKVLQEPGKIRSKDLAAFDGKAVDYLVIKKDDVEFKFFKVESKDDMPFMPPHQRFGGQTEWYLFVGKEKHKANGQAVQKLIDHLQGKKAIAGFDDVPEADVAKREAEWGLDKKSPEITVFLNAVEAKKDDEKDEKKGEKKGEKKDEKKDDKKKETTDKNTPPTLKKDLKPALTLSVGTIGADKDKDKDKEILVHVRRLLDEGKLTSRITLKKEFIEKLLPTEGVELAFLDSSMPSYNPQEAVSFSFQRTTDKGPETLEFVRRGVDGRPFWYQKDSSESHGVKLADSDQVMKLVGMPSNLPTKKIVKKLEDKDDLDQFGLKTPSMVVTVKTQKQPLPIEVLSRLVGMLATFTPIEAIADAVAQTQIDKGEVVTIEFGKEATDEKDKPGVFARHSGSKLLFLVEPEVVKFMRDADVRDRLANLRAQPLMEILYKGAAAANPEGALLFLSPHFSGAVHQFDADKIKEVKLDVRTPAELRSMHLVRDVKDKTWGEKSGLREFQPDSEKVNQFVKDLAKFKTDRFATFALPPGTTPKDPKEAPRDPLADYRLGTKDFTLKVEFVTEDGKTITLLVGATPQPNQYFGHSSYWPDAVFFVPGSMVEPLLRGPAHFAKERIAGN